MVRLRSEPQQCRSAPHPETELQEDQKRSMEQQEGREADHISVTGVTDSKTKQKAAQREWGKGRWHRGPRAHRGALGGLEGFTRTVVPSKAGVKIHTHGPGEMAQG